MSCTALGTLDGRSAPIRADHLVARHPTLDRSHVSTMSASSLGGEVDRMQGPVASNTSAEV